MGLVPDEPGWHADRTEALFTAQLFHILQNLLLDDDARTYYVKPLKLASEDATPQMDLGVIAMKLASGAYCTRAAQDWSSKSCEEYAEAFASDVRLVFEADLCETRPAHAVAVRLKALFEDAYSEVMRQEFKSLKRQGDRGAAPPCPKRPRC